MTTHPTLEPTGIVLAGHASPSRSLDQGLFDPVIVNTAATASVDARGVRANPLEPIIQLQATI